VTGLAAIYGVRMLGLFLMLPVLALYGRGLPGGTPALAGLAVGAYGLTQAILQLPFGIASDRIGRRPVIAVGLLVYAAGSVLCAGASTVWGLIAARMLAGAGAVSGPITALLADLTRSAVRTRAMALIGISIGGAFVISLLGAPLLQPLIGVRGLFLGTGLLALLCLVLLYTVVPAPSAAAPRPAAGRALRPAFRAELLPHYVGIFVLNAVLTATFMAVPFALHDRLGIPLAEHWRTYLGVFLASIPPTIPLILWTERAAEPERVMCLAIALLAVALAAAAWVTGHYWPLWGALTVFFIAFNYLEARLPARLSQAAAPEIRGAALSVFAIAQFLGSFGGAAVAGWLYGGALGPPGVFAAAFLLTLAWLLLYCRQR
jgi:MFS family permease